MKIIKQSCSLEQITPNALELIEKAGRTCYKSEGMMCDGSSEKFIKKILDPTRKHESVIEHAFATIRFITDRGVTHEMVRHRLASYSQESTRYCNYTKDKFGNEITVILPVRFYDWYDEHEHHADTFWNTEYESIENSINCQYALWHDACSMTESSYFDCLKSGQTPQEARDVLPNSLKTEIVMTANFREWLHFFTLRCAKTAHPQMQDLAKQALVLLHNEVPIIFDDLYQTYFG